MAQDNPPPNEEPTSILELKGLGKECWEGVDPAAYIAEERKAWGCEDHE